MINIAKLGTLSLVVATFLVGCGSDSDTNTKSNNSSNATTTTNKIGYFVDAPIEGSAYITSSGIEGTTDKTGRFRYKEGDSVKFSIGNLTLGETTPTEDGLITPEGLAHGDEELKVLLLRVLQSLDSDNDPSNGITIPSIVIDSLSDINETEITTEEKLLDIDNELALAIDEDFDGVVDTNETEAIAHFENSTTKWEEHRPTDAGQDEEHGNRPEDAGQNSEQHGNSGENGHSQDTNQTEDCNNSVDVTSSPLSTLTPELKNAIAYMGNEERLAYDVYHNLYDYHNSENAIAINQLKNISEKSEIKHVGIVQDIVKKYSLAPEELTNVIDPVATRDISFTDMPSGRYDIPAIQGLYDALYAKGITSQKDALEVGCMVEVTDIDDLDRYIAMAQTSNAPDVEEAFNFLRDGSYNHYWAFDNGLKNIGIADGCCSLGTIDGVNYCHSEYPQNEHGNGSQNGRGQDNRR